MIVPFAQLGSDIKIERAGDGELAIHANVMVKGGISIHKLRIGDMSLEDFVAKLVADAVQKKCVCG